MANTQSTGEKSSPHSPEIEGGRNATVRFATHRSVLVLRWHAIGFLILNATLGLANVVTGGVWWAFWPLIATAIFLGLHYIVYKSLTVSEEWADERVEEINLKSYDRGHIEDLKARYLAQKRP